MSDKLEPIQGDQHVYKIQKDPANGLILIKDNAQVFCHKVPPMPTRGAIEGQVNFFRFPCCTNCSKARILAEGQDDFYEVSCDGTVGKFKINNQPPAESGKILSIS